MRRNRRKVRFVALAVVASVVGYPAAEGRAASAEDTFRTAAAWLEARHYPVGSGFPVICHESNETYAQHWGVGRGWEGALAFSGRRGIGLSPRACFFVRWLSSRPSGPVVRNGQAARYATLVLHELLHRVGHDSIWYHPRATDEDRWLEEGITEQVARDLTPAYLWHAFRLRHRGPVTYGAYEDRTAAVRAASVYATGAPNYRAYIARKWREAWIKQNLTGRRYSLALANNTRSNDVR